MVNGQHFSSDGINSIEKKSKRKQSTYHGAAVVLGRAPLEHDGLVGGVLGHERALGRAGRLQGPGRAHPVRLRPLAAPQGVHARHAEPQLLALLERAYRLFVKRTLKRKGV